MWMLQNQALKNLIKETVKNVKKFPPKQTTFLKEAMVRAPRAASTTLRKLLVNKKKNNLAMQETGRQTTTTAIE